jgi:glucose-1-phosphate thymidylyltransferase
MAKVRRNVDRNKRIIGLVPAAGQATRLSPLPFSKELYPIGHMRFKDVDDFRPKPVCIYLLEKMKAAGIKDVYIILRKGKWDIPGYLGDGSLLDMNFAYLIMNIPYGVPYTLNQAFPFLQDTVVAFGFPDIIFKTDNAYKQLLTHQINTNADVVLGLFPVDRPNKFHMVELSYDLKVEKIVMNPKVTHLKYTWIIAVWTENFSRFMNDLLINKKKIESSKTNHDRRELHLSEVIQHAIDNKLLVEGVIYPTGYCLDIGTSGDLIQAVCETSDTNFKKSSKK